MTYSVTTPMANSVAVPRQGTAPAPALPLRGSTEIQGDILAGFKKDHVQLLFLTFGDPELARRWLGRLRHRVAATREVAAFNEAFSRARRNAAGGDPHNLNAVWRAVSFTYSGLAELVGGDPIADVPAGTTQWAFREGAARRADALGDTGPSDPATWLFGAGHNDPVHAVLTVAADRAEDLRAALAREQEEIATHRLAIAFEQYGATLEGVRRGKEHFGFKDSISQPGVQGFDEPDPANTEYQLGKPGTRIIPAGEFLIGHATDHRLPAALPDWMVNGSFHVVRRLAQDVPGWWAQIADLLGALKERGAVPPEATSEWLAARMFGRWRSGTPVVKSPDSDLPAHPGAEADNDFGFKDDLDGRITPLFSHLRKANPRDGLKVRPDQPEPLGLKGALDGRRIMRRGVPYGMPFDPAGGPGNGPDAPRGMVFVCYQADLLEQFEFIQRTWVEGDNFPERPEAVGRDAVIGREGAVSFPAGGASSAGNVPLTLRQFVRTEGCVYAFAPSLPALKRLAEGDIPPGGGSPEEQVLTAPAVLRRGEVLSSGKARLRFRDATGDLTVHDENEVERWSTRMSNNDAVRAEFLADGRLVLPDTEGAILWSTPTEGNPGATLVVQVDGDVVIRAADGRTLWHTDTAHE
ncbi:Dyp-type peroxidase [Streptomyces litchfieldiae]|uniref:Dyp-type peroxidase n=1 Tax=Streptomyces litchfieldiae TaxID=3075543 RepID=A0ABU2MRH1_9ACTN|nr:Dyp-type peroxidase [Streptomyces sp. DSM 44938]MDT0344225.1 Dyp-type peroxidase [Streptomyces sp. DSM 44938]